MENNRMAVMFFPCQLAKAFTAKSQVGHRAMHTRKKLLKQHIISSSLALKMNTKFDEYWWNCRLTLAVAAILDPRVKMKLVEYFYPLIYDSSSRDFIDIVSCCMKALYNGTAICSMLDSHSQGLACQALVGLNQWIG
ncbi:hypothetical protein Vadar_022533 [Vaccinium darrowii]|uniref:Uncharacterized protein n=1 Tax=Vaccinium darrowii TaxID=229202 RepID=A0ACB7XJ95_9ERIC|nr:hypothetical protein Vadar_022533 [Vaccinium darrowii]